MTTFTPQPPPFEPNEKSPSEPQRGPQEGPLGPRTVRGGKRGLKKAWEGLPSSANGLRVLASGVDTLHLSTKQPLRPQVVAELDCLREAARGVGDDVTKWPKVEIAGQILNIRPVRNRHRGTIAFNANMQLSLNPEPMWHHSPWANIEIQAPYLWARGYRAAGADAVALLDSCCITGNSSPDISRIDVTADFQGWDICNEFTLEDFITRAARKSAPYWLYRQFSECSGFNFGMGGTTVARLYDKTRELQKSPARLAVYEDGWSKKGYEQGKKVMRLEFQNRRAALREFAPVLNTKVHVLEKWRTGQDYVKSIFDHLALNWLYLPGKRKKNQRRVFDVRWKKIVDDSSFDGGASNDIVRVMRLAENSNSLGQVAAYVSRAASNILLIEKERQDDLDPDASFKSMTPVTPAEINLENLIKNVCRDATNHALIRGESLQQKIARMLNERHALELARKRGYS